MRNNWTNHDNQLFLHRNDGVFWLSDIAKISAIDFVEGTFSIECLCPIGLEYFFEFSNGCTFEIVNKNSGNLSVYEEDKVIMRFANCALESSYIFDMTSLYPDDKSIVRLQLDIKAIIEKVSNA